MTTEELQKLATKINLAIFRRKKRWFMLLGPTGEQRCIALHDRVKDEKEALIDALNKVRSNIAWHLFDRFH